MLAYVNMGIATSESIPPSLLALGGGFLAVSIAFHLVLRWRASYADPLMLPIVTLLNGLGLVMIHRLDIAKGNSLAEGVALRQLMWSALAVAIAVGVLVARARPPHPAPLHLPRRRHRPPPAPPAPVPGHRHLGQRVADLDPVGGLQLPAR